jgi:shikimate dehydrogenase
MRRFGLVGNKLTHSFSAEYFARKFSSEGITNTVYELYPLKSVAEITELLSTQRDISGLNVTIPFKKLVIPLLDKISEQALQVGAVNCIKVIRNNGKIFLKGYNTDVYGFLTSFEPLLQKHHTHALVLGNGGAASSVTYVLQKLGIKFLIVTRNPLSDNQISYSQITPELVRKHTLIIQTTPLGMFPDIDTKPEIPYYALSDAHLLYDLVYNPEQTLFLNEGKKAGAQTKSGLQMLEMQAEKSWQIWHETI